MAEPINPMDINGKIIVEEATQFTDEHGTGDRGYIDGDIDVPGTVLINGEDGPCAQNFLCGDIDVAVKVYDVMDGDVDVAVPTPSVDIIGDLQIIPDKFYKDIDGNIDVLGAEKTEAFVSGDLTINKETATPLEILGAVQVIYDVNIEIDGDVTVNPENISMDIPGEVNVALTSGTEISGSIEVGVKHIDEVSGELNVIPCTVKELGGYLIVSGDYHTDIKGDMTVIQKSTKDLSGDITVGVSFRKDLFGEVEVEAKKNQRYRWYYYCC